MTDKLEVIDLRANYFKVTNELFEQGFSSYEIAVYAFLCRLRNNNTNKCFPSLTTIADKTGCSKRKVQDCISKLCEKNFIHKVHGYNTSNRYILLPVAPDSKRVVEEAMNSLPDDVAQDAIGEAHSAMGIAHDATEVGHEVPPNKTNNNNTKTKKTKIKKKPFSISEIVNEFKIPPDFNNAKFHELLLEYKEHKKEIKSPLTERALKMTVKKLINYPFSTVIEAIETAIEKGWKGVYPESIKTNNNLPTAQELPNGGFN
jgi:DNA-binding MarR family transcriptional regulator